MGRPKRKATLEDEKPAKQAKKAGKDSKQTAQNQESKEKPIKTTGTLKKGDTLPDMIALPTDEADNEISLKEVVQDKGVVIFMYPKANTGGCTRQACLFRDHIEEFDKAGYAVYGLSADSPKSQASWKQKYNIPFTLLSDPTRQVIKALGASRGDKGINRSHIVVAKGGVIQDVCSPVSPAESWSKALATIQG